MDSLSLNCEPKQFVPHAPPTPAEPYLADIPERYATWTLDDYPEFATKTLSDFIDSDAWSLYLFGPIGTRKSSLAAAMLKRWRKDNPGKVGHFATVEGIVRHAEDRDDWYQAQCCGVHLLVIDDLGAVRRTAFTADALNVILRTRYDKARKTISTGNLTVEEFAEKIDERIADRLRDGMVRQAGTESKRGERATDA